MFKKNDSVKYTGSNTATLLKDDEGTVSKDHNGRAQLECSFGSSTHFIDSDDLEKT